MSETIKIYKNVEFKIKQKDQNNTKRQKFVK